MKELKKQIKQIKTNVELKAFLDTFEEVTGEWDGGNDSGSWNMRGDGKTLSTWDDYFDKIVEKALDYGSWAGNFSSTGTISYDKTTGVITLQGDEYDSENKELIKTVELELFIPDTILQTIDEIEIYAYHNDGCKVIYFVETGAVLDIHETHAEELSKELTTKTNDIEKEEEEDFYFNDTFDVSEVKNNILRFEINVEKETHKEIYHLIDLNDE